MKTISLVYFNAGGGHRAAAMALEAAIRQQGRPWRVELVNLFEVLDPQDRFRKLTGFAPEAYYNQRLARGWTIGLAQELRLLQATIRLLHPPMVQRLQAHWAKTAPDLVVSLVPNFNRAMFESLAAALPGVPYVTVLTDLADHPPNFWIEPGQRQHLICGTPKALAQAREAGCEERFLHLVSGMLLRPDFYPPADADTTQPEEPSRDPERPTGVVMFGGEGSAAMLRIAEALPETPLILMCGRNRELAAKLRAMPAVAPRTVVEHTPEVARWMRRGDFFIGKPGPGSLSEALQCGLPVIVTRNRSTMPQERYNTDWVRELGVGLVLPSFGKIADAVAEMTQRLPAFRERLRSVRNRAVFEVPEILAAILETAAETVER